MLAARQGQDVLRDLAGSLVADPQVMVAAAASLGVFVGNPGESIRVRWPREAAGLGAALGVQQLAVEICDLDDRCVE